MARYEENVEVAFQIMKYIIKLIQTDFVQNDKRIMLSLKQDFALK